MLTLEILLAAYIFARAVLPLRLRFRWKALLALPLLAAAFKFHLLRLVGGPLFYAPDLPDAAMLVSAWLFGALLLFFAMLLAADLVSLLLRVIFRRFRTRSENGRARRNRLNLGLRLAALALAAVGTSEGLAPPEVRETTVVLPSLPAADDGLTVAVLADTHFDGMTEPGRVRRIVELTNALHPDMIVIVGDFADGPVERRGEQLRPLAELTARYGVYGVPGNHEYYNGYEEWMRRLSGLGIRMLENEHVAVADGSIFIGGVTDQMAYRRNLAMPDVAKAFEGAPPGAFKILLSHRPQLVKEAEKAGVALQISGHTHGGMVPGLNLLVALANGGFASGLHHVGGTALFVSNGAGIWSGLPLRLGIPSEIALLRLRRR